MNLSGLLSRLRSAGPRHLNVGVWGEKQAAKYLRRKGYTILEKRARVGKHGEIDLITQYGETLVFVEVKTRSAHGKFRPGAAVNRRKKQVLTRAAAGYLGRMKRKPGSVRFDIVEVIGNMDDRPEIRHIEGAFKMNDFRSMKW